MFYTYGEKQGNVFFDGWQMRQVAFDTMRRYLYYSGALSERHIATPNNTDYLSLPNSAASSPNTAGIPGMQPDTPRSNLNVPTDVQWKRKIKVDLIVVVAREHAFQLDDAHLKETDLLQIELHGETRPLFPGEAPAPGPLLCGAAGLAGHSERFCPENDEFIRDPFFLRELYESLRDQFTNLRLERERVELVSRNAAAAAAAQASSSGAALPPPPPPPPSKIQTLRSPRGKGSYSARGSRIKIVFRMRTEYEFRRFWYVVQTVLGYDKLCARPYRGLPPYDPRNGIIFTQLPMCVWHTFRALDKAVMYTFTRGDLIGRNTSGDLVVYLRGAYLCITHDSVLIFRSTGEVRRSLKLIAVNEFLYNAKCDNPYIAFLSDPGAPDIVFVPQPPVFGPDAIRCYNPAIETMRVHRVIYETCFTSLDVRRIIEIKEVDQRSVRSFIVAHEADPGSRLNLEPTVLASNPNAGRLPTEQLAQVWAQVQALYAARDPSIVSQAAIPLYANHTNDVHITAAQMVSLNRRLSRQRSTADDIVGLSYAEVQQLPAQEERHHHRSSTAHVTGHQDPTLLRGGAVTAAPSDDEDNTVQLPRSRDRAATATTAAAASSLSPLSTPPVRLASEPISVIPPALRSPGQDLAQVLPTRSPPLPLGLPGVRHEEFPNESFCSNTGSTSVSVTYGLPGARYITREEIENRSASSVPEYIVDHHALISGQSFGSYRGAMLLQSGGGPLIGSVPRSTNVRGGQGEAAVARANNTSQGLSSTHVLKPQDVEAARDIDSE